MEVRAIVAESSPVTEDDLRKRDLVKELLQTQNQRIVDFAKQLLTISFSAIGVVLAFKEKWLRADGPPYQKIVLGIAIAMFLATSVLATLAADIYLHRVSLSDYAEVDVELQRVAKVRLRLTRLAFGMSAMATVLVALVAFCA
jgi:hypothetical protein